jgi:ABC-2 type transport system permease protein
MYALLKKELSSFFATPIGWLVIGVFLLLIGSLLWLIPGNNNVLDSGYAQLNGLFDLAPWVFLFLIPAITMRSFADEYKQGTIEWLQTKPISRWQITGAKYLAGLLLVILALLPTLVYLFSVCYLGTTFANIDMGAFWGSFIGLVLLAMVYVAIGVCVSSYTDNAVVAFVLSAFISFIAYVGFDFLALLSDSGSVQDFICQWGISSHYESISRGVLDMRDVCYFVVVSALVLAFTFQKRLHKTMLLYVLAAVMLIAGSHWLVWRIDLTAENRYTLSKQTKQLLREQEHPISVTVYLDGDLNMGFLQLKKATADLLREMDVYAAQGIQVHYTNPSKADSQKQRQENYAALERQGMRSTVVHNRDSEGQMQQKIVFPWAVFSAHNDTIPVLLLKNLSGKSGEDNLNISIENLEYEFTDAIRILSTKEVQKVAFLEGHGELTEPYVYDITTKLARYYQVDRGVLGTDVSLLDPYKVLIIAQPESAFSETDKFIIDQYLMNGGRVLWLIDGVATNGEVGKVNDVNLTDQLFTYGIRLSPTLLLDVQCALVPLQVDGQNASPDFQPAPWYYSPLLMPSSGHAITRHLSPVKAQFASHIELVGMEQNKDIAKTVLLASSAHTALEKAPMQLTTAIVNLSPQSPYFAYAYLPVAALFEGQFTSVYANRMPPAGMDMRGRNVVKNSAPTKMIVVADGSVIANELHGFGDGYEPLPLGYDTYMNQQFGNDKFILNAINYLADDDGWMQLRNRQFTLRLLDKQKIATQRVTWQAINMVLPLVLLITFSAAYQIIRRKQYAK